MWEFFQSDAYKILYVITAWIFIFMIFGDGVKHVVGIVGFSVSTVIITMVAIGSIVG